MFSSNGSPDSQNLPTLAQLPLEIPVGFSIDAAGFRFTFTDHRTGNWKCEAINYQYLSYRRNWAFGSDRDKAIARLCIARLQHLPMHEEGALLLSLFQSLEVTAWPSEVSIPAVGGITPYNQPGRTIPAIINKTLETRYGTKN